jgi:Ca2+-binding RTX toxin-like protein
VAHTHGTIHASRIHPFRKVSIMAMSSSNRPSDVKSAPARNRPARQRTVPAAAEPLPNRLMLSVTALFTAGELRVTGDAQDNVIAISRDAAGTIFVNNGAIPIQGGTPTVANTTHLHLVGADGNDAITLNETNGRLPGAALFGGTGNDTLIGGSGIDFVAGEAGSDRVSMGPGDDTFQWNPGDGSDMVDGQAGRDSIVFNGSDLAERFDILDSGAGAPFHRVRLTRDLGSVSMDLGTIEDIDLNPLGGGDLITVSDATATDLFTVNLDLEGSGGSGDGQPDSIVLNGTEGDDVELVQSFGNRVTANASLFPFVNIDGADGLNDALILNAAGGNDELDASSVSPNAIGMVLIGGTGDDQITGSPGVDSVNAGAGNDKVFLGAGDDSFFWNPGEGSDVVEGQDGIDTMNVHGSADAETFDLSANGSRFRLTRDVENVKLDVDGVEQVAVSVGNGGDNIVLNDLTGTAVTALKFTLSGLLQLDADHVIINGTNGADAIHVEGDLANGVTVTGLAAGLRIGGSEGPVDSVTINGLGGADTVNAADLSEGAVSFSMDGGAGNDTLTASQGSDVINGGTEADTINVIATEPGSVVKVLPSSGDDTVNVNTDLVGPANVLFDATQRLRALNIGSGGIVTLTSGGAKVLTVSSLVLAGSGTLDLNDNDLILDYTGNSPLSGVGSLLQHARNGGAWNGAGLTSTFARNATPHNTTLGLMEATDFKAINGPAATFDGQAIDDTAVLVKYTYYGDADFNGKVNFDDYVRIDRGFNNRSSGWTNGDFDGNGAVNFDDYVLIDLGFNTQGATL